MKNRLSNHRTSVASAVVGALFAAPALAQSYDNMPGGWQHQGMQGMGGWPMLFGGLMMILVLAAVIAVVILIVRAFTGGSHATPPTRTPERSALDILDERYARGEIDQEDYQQRKKDLGG